MTREEMQAARDTALKACAEEVQAALNRYGCQFRAVPVIDDEGRVRARVELVVKP